LFFRKKRRKVDPAQQGAGYLVLDGDWTGEIYTHRPIKVAAALDVQVFLEQRPMPSIWPDDKEFNAWVAGSDDLMRRLWVIVVLHHPNPDVRVQCLRSPYIEGALHAAMVADLLIDSHAADAAADAVWRMDDSSVRVVLNVVLSRGLVPSGFSPQQTNRAVELLRSTCPQQRREFFEAEIFGHHYEQISVDLVELVEAATRRYETLSREQQERWHDLRYLDELVRGGTPLEWLADIVEIRAIGHRLNAEGGFPLMQAVAQRVGELSEHRMAARNLDRWFWDRIGDWLG